MKNNNPAPIAPSERIAAIDIIRGFALIGILLVNLKYFAHPAMYQFVIGENIWEGFNGFIDSAIFILAEGKFYTMFSFLFGLGFIVFMDKAMKKSPRPKLLFARRLFILFIFGVIHAFLIWSGDILIAYAIAGFILLLFYKRKEKTLLVWSGIILSISIIPVLFMVAAFPLMEQIPGEEYSYANEMTMFINEIETQIESSYYAYSEGSLLEVMEQRLTDTTFALSYSFFAYLSIIPMFLLGAYAGKRKILHDVKNHLPLIKKVWLISFIIGASMTAVYYINLQQVNFVSPSMHDIYTQVGSTIGNPSLMLFYVTSLVLLLQKSMWQRILKPLTALGRMALTNYLMQSIICTFVFYSYGLGLYGSVTPPFYLLFVVVIIGGQIVLSNWWLKRYYFGPAEWLWRSLTYGKKAKMKIPEEPEYKEVS